MFFPPSPSSWAASPTGRPCATPARRWRRWASPATRASFRPIGRPTGWSPSPRARARPGSRSIIAGAGGAAHLPGMTAAMTPLPVLGVPVESKALSGRDSLYSIVQMPGGVPVGTLAIGKPGAINAALLAASILALNDEKLREAARRLARAADRRPSPNGRKMTEPQRLAPSLPARASESSAAANWAACWRLPPRGSAFRAISTPIAKTILRPKSPPPPPSRLWRRGGAWPLRRRCRCRDL